MVKELNVRLRVEILSKNANVDAVGASVTEGFGGEDDRRTDFDGSSSHTRPTVRDPVTKAQLNAVAH